MIDRRTPPVVAGAAFGPDLEPYLGYIRVSTWKEEKISPELQRAAISEWARRTGRRIIDWIEDLDESGRHFKRKIMGGIERVERGEARGIAVWRYSRFGRDRVGTAVNLARIESVGGHLQSATEQVDATTAIGRFQRGMILEFGAFESDRTGEAWRETHEHRRAMALPATGRPRFGYIWHPRRLPDGAGGWTTQREFYEPHPEIGPVCADLYRRYVAGDGFPRLCASLNEAGYRTTRGALWTTPTLNRYLSSGFPAGLLRIHDAECHCAGRRTNGSCPNYVLRVGAQEELISTELWDAYQARREIVRATPPRARQAVYTLTGITRCGLCRGGTGLTSAARAGHIITGWGYRCTLRLSSGGAGCSGVWIPRPRVEAAVRAWLADHAAGIDAAPTTPLPGQRDIVSERARAARARVRLQAERQQLDDALKRLILDAAMNPGKYPDEAFSAARDELTRRRDAALTALSRVAHVEEQPAAEDYQPMVVGLLAEWETLIVAERNALLRQLIRRVALTRRAPGADGVHVEVHPVWEPDPWARPADDDAETGAGRAC